MELEQFRMFMDTYGWQMALIAFIGIVILGILKYANAFSKIEKEKRKPIYFAITIGFSLVATIIYLLIIGQFSITYILTVAPIIYGMNQTMYAFYETCTLRELVNKILDAVFKRTEQKK